MSYNIAIVDFILPDNFEDACKLVNPLTSVDVETVKEIFKKFHSEITKIYPCICDLPDDQEDEGVWCDGPLINNFTTKAPVIGLTLNKVEDSLPIISKIALGMGLSILDWQSGQTYNP